MPYSPYLLSVVRALRDEVAPKISNEEGQASLKNCIRTLAFIASGFARAEEPHGDQLPLDALPEDLRSQLADMDLSKPENLSLPVGSPPDDLPGGTIWGKSIACAANWVGSKSPTEFSENLQTIMTLVAWEQGQRRDQLEQIHTIEYGSAEDATDEAIFVNIERKYLQDYMRQTLNAPELSVDEFRMIPGGRSRQTVIFRISGSDEIPARLVCQRDHPANVNPNGNVSVQFPLLEILYEGGMLVPRPILFEMNRDILGAPFMLTEQVGGDVVIDAGSEYYAPPPNNPALACSLATQLGHLHSVSASRVSEFLRKPVAGGTVAAWRAELERIKSNWHKNVNGASITVEAAFSWLEQNIDCISHQRVIVHNDMLLHNVLAEGDELSAVLDWELSHIGHPAEDLGYVLPVMVQMVDWDRFMSAYVAAGGIPLSRREVDWFSLRALLFLATLAQGSRDMVDTGISDDVRVAETGVAWLPPLKERLSVTLQSIFERDAF